MKRTIKILLAVLLFLAAVALTAFYICSHNIAVLEPKGVIGQKECDLIITSSLLMLIVVIPVFLFALVFSWRYRASNAKARHEPNWEHNYIAEYCWWGVPLIIIVILAIITWKSSHELNPFKPIDSDKTPLTIQVVALEWKWLFIYPEQKIATVNFVQFPEKTPINFEITADAPMNSFWIPQLGGQIYAMPAMRSKLHLMANETGIFRGCSANISGSGFAGMKFDAKSCNPEEFDQWIGSVQQTGRSLDFMRYRDLVKPSEYDPVTYFTLGQEDLFHEILMQYMAPQQ